MIKSLRLKNFKGFSDHRIEFGEFSVIVGRNNAGKSSVIEALRVIATVSNKFLSTKFTSSPPWTGFETCGIAPTLDGIGLKREAIFHKYSAPPAIIEAEYANGSTISIYFGPQGAVYAEAANSKGAIATNRPLARACAFTPICILPQIAPLEDYETVLRKVYVDQCIETHLSSRHFRNQIRFMYEYFDSFRDLFQQTWSGVRIASFESEDARYEDELSLMLGEDGFVAEASNFGHGLQMWLQIVWFLARTSSKSVVILDEPDVYMHPEQQSKMVEILRGRFEQCILSTHAVKIIEECDDLELLRLHRKLSKSLRGMDQETHDEQIDQAIKSSNKSP